MVEVGDHAQHLAILLRRISEIVKKAHILIGHLLVPKTMRQPERHVSEERSFARLAHETDRLIRDHVIKKSSLGQRIDAVAGKGRGETVKVVPDNRYIKPAVVRPEGIVLAEMPLPENAGFVAGLTEIAGQGLFVSRQVGPPAPGIPHPGAKLVAPCQDLGAGRRAKGRGVKAPQPDALGLEPVQVRRLENRMPHGRQIPESLVIGYNEDNVRTRSRNQWHFLPGSVGRQQNG